jgi:hypothetical protein
LSRYRIHTLPVWTFPIAGVFLIALWQCATVTANYGGNWTALFCTGAIQPAPPLAASEHLYLFVNSTGYDGQIYHYVAHDPFLRTNLKSYVDDARLRYRRILVPLLAYLFALGQSRLIDSAYELVCLLSIGLGVYFSCRFAQNAGLTAAWGLLFLTMPAIPITMDRLVIDGGLAALTAAFLCYSRAPSWKLFVVLACAALTRETGFLLALAYCAHLAWRREFRMAGFFLLSLAPALAWYGFVQANAVGRPYEASLIPLSSILWVLANPWSYPPGTPFPDAVRAADYLALAGVLLAFGLAFVGFLRKPGDPLRIAASLFAAMALVVQRPDQWQNVYSFGRVYTPVLLCLAAIGAQDRNPWLLAPVAMMLPRIAIQLAPQVLGVIRWIA